MKLLSLMLILTGLFLPHMGQAENLIEIRALSQEGDSLAVNQDQHLSYYFGSVPLHTRPVVTYKVSNNSDKPLGVKGITLSGAGFDQYNNCPSVLEARKYCLTRIAFWPHWIGPHLGHLVWALEDGNIFLNLWGDGVQ